MTNPITEESSTRPAAEVAQRPIKFFVFIVESPSAPDLYHRRTEGEILEQLLRLQGTTCVSRLAISREAFEAALKIGLSEEMRDLPDLMPILHISAHGFEDGIQLSNGEVLLWEELKEVLLPVNAAFQGFLVVCMSSCSGYSGIRMAMEVDGELPFFALVGCADSPTWSETAVAFSTFYHLIGRGAFLQDAVAAMRTASGNASFFADSGEALRQSFLEYIATPRPSEVRDELESEAQKEPPGELAKLRALEDAPSSLGAREA